MSDSMVQKWVQQFNGWISMRTAVRNQFFKGFLTPLTVQTSNRLTFISFLDIEVFLVSHNFQDDDNAKKNLGCHQTQYHSPIWGSKVSCIAVESVPKGMSTMLKFSKISICNKRCCYITFCIFVTGKWELLNGHPI